MRFTGLEQRPKVVTQKVICDDCGEDCTNTNIEVIFKFSFSENQDHYKDVCLTCWEKKYKKEWHVLRDKTLDQEIQYHLEKQK